MSKIRLSSVHANSETKISREWTLERNRLKSLLGRNGYKVIDGNKSDNVCLSGNQGAESHVKQTDGYVFFGKPTIGDMFMLSSLFVGIQTLDTNLHFQEDTEKYRKPILIHGDLAHHNDFLDQLVRLGDEGTIRQKIFGPEGILRITQNHDEVLAKLKRRTKAANSIHGHGAVIGQESPHKTGDFKFLDMPRPEYNVCVFTSASLNQPSHAMEEIAILGRGIAQHKNGLVTGIGSTGLMGGVVKACVDAGGWSAGSNCPHIMDQEGTPEGCAEHWIRPDIYTRMEAMLKNSDAIVISGGGRGGAGTLQEALACVLLLERGSTLMKSADRKTYKPLIIDDRLELWGGLIKIAESRGLVRDKHFHIASGSENVLDILTKIKEKAISPASTTVPIKSPNLQR